MPLAEYDDGLDRTRRALTARRSGTWKWCVASEQLSVRLVGHGGDAIFGDRTHHSERPCPVYPDDSAWFFARAREALQDGRRTVVLPLRLRVGKTARWFLATGRLHHDVGTAGALAGYVTEVEERQHSMESFYGAVLDSLIEEVAIIDRQGHIVETNRAWNAPANNFLVPCRRLPIGSNYVEALQMAASEDPAAAEVLAGITGVLSGRELFFEHEYSRADDEHWCAVRAFRLQRAEGGLVLIQHDVTDRRLAERERELHRAELGRTARAAVLGQLSGAIAHELNQPLTAILANAQAGLEGGAHGASREELLEILRDIEGDTKRAGEVIKRVRGLLRLDHANLKTLDLNQVVEDVLLLSRSDLIVRGVAVAKALDPSTPPLHGDAIQLQQLVLNLIVNSCEAMTPLARTNQELRISTSANEEGGSRLTISDNGPGFGVGEREKVLQPFYTTKEKGLGLGLTICRSIVQAHGGRLQLGNDDTGGARVTVEFPAADATRPPPSGNGRLTASNVR